MKQKNINNQIIVIGGGAIGLGFARAVAELGVDVTVVEKQKKNALENPAYDGREIALTHKTQKIMTRLGVWDLIEKKDISLIKRARVFNGDSPYALCFDHEESLIGNLGFMVANDIIRRAMYLSVESRGNIKLITDKALTAISTDARKAVITMEDGRELEAGLVVAADSRFSTSRRLMGIATSMIDFGRNCVVGKMTVEKHGDNTAYECFHFDRTLAILPLNNNQVSIVITLDTKENDALLALDAESFARDIEARIGNEFGKMTLESPLFSYPLVAHFAKSLCAKRFALIGDAALGMHPVTAHGFNLGLAGAFRLSTLVKEALYTGQDIATPMMLERYSRQHRKACAPLYHSTNMLVKLYTKTTPAAKLARATLLRLGNRFGPARRLITNQLTETGSL